MSKKNNLPNLAKHIQNLIRKIIRESNEITELSKQEDYNFREDNRLYTVKFGRRLVVVTRSTQKDIEKLLNQFEQVFNAENVEYDIEQVESELNGFIEKLKTSQFEIYYFNYLILIIRRK